tara:strand:- start:88984 stop:101430 length:12447 start_codon:yes stop_codon:yes gene_type:complete
MSASSIAYEYCQRLIHRFSEHRKTRRVQQAKTVRSERHATGPICESLENRVLLSGDLTVAYVDDNYAALVIGDDPDGAGPATAFGTDAFATIQQAIDNLQVGGTIHVADGTYTENISITQNLTLLSDNGRDVTFINGISGEGALGAITISNATSGVNIGDVGQGFSILGIDNGAPGIENAAVYLQGSHSGMNIIGNDIIANGEAGLLTEYGASVGNILVDNNIFSGQTFNGANPAGEGFSQQFSLDNVPRQLVNFGGGSGSSNYNIFFTNNQITGTAGGLNTDSAEQGNTLVTLDAQNSVIINNTFAGTTTRYGAALRVRGSGATTIQGNTFDSTNMGDNTSMLETQIGTINGYTSINNKITDFDNDFNGGAYLVGGTTVVTAIEGIIENAPDGSTINILAGQYDADITITHNDITVYGPSSEFAKLDSSTRTRNGEAEITGGFRVQGDNVTIAGLTILNGVGPAGIGDITAVHLAAGTTGHTIANNAIIGTDASGSRGIVASSPVGSFTVENNDISAWTSGMYINAGSDGVQILNNIIHDNFVGMSADNATNLTIANNFFANNSFEHIGLGAPGAGVVANENSFDANGPSISNYGGVEIDASNNWWGTTDLALIGANLTANASSDVDYSPILNNGTDLYTYPEYYYLPDYFGFQPDTSNITVHTQGSQTDSFSLLGEGLSAVIGTNGTFILNGQYTGAIALNGNITIGGDFDLDGSLALDGSITLSPGNSPASISTGDLTMTAGTTLAIELFGTTPGTEYDQVNVTGAVDITDATLDLTLGYYPSTSGDSFTVINNDDTDAITGTFDGLAEGASFVISYGGVDFDATITYVGGDGNDVVIATDAYTLPDVYVDDDWAGLAVGDDPDGLGPLQGFGFDAFANIQDAIDAVDTGGIVHIAAGDYDQGTITINKDNVTLLGTQAGVDARGRDNVDVTDETVIHGSIYIDHNIEGTTIDGLFMQDFTVASLEYFGVFVSGGAVDTTVQNLYFQGTDPSVSQNGIVTSIAGTTNNVFTQNVYDNTFYGVYLNPNSVNNQITDSLITNTRIGYVIDTAENTTVTGNTFDSSTGLYFWDGGTASVGDNTGVTVANNIFQNGTGIRESYVTVNDPGITVDLSNNIFDGKLPAAMSLDELFDLEDNITHAIDDAAYDSVGIVVADNLYVTQLSGSIQNGIDAASAGDTLHIQTGTYTENLTIDKTLQLLGAGSGLTILEAGSDIGINVTAGGTSAADADRLLISGLTINNAASMGIVIDGTVSYITIDDVDVNVDGVKRTDYGLEVAATANVTDLLIDNSSFSTNYEGAGMHVHGSVDGLTITDSHFDGNNIGFYAFQVDGSNTILNNVNITDSTFNDNTYKGLYIEKLDNALLDNITVNNSGTLSGTTDGLAGYEVWPTGIDLNLKYYDYENITIQNASITDSGTANPENGVGLAIKTRDDGSYATHPATLNGLTIIDNVITGAQTSVRFGEPDKDNTGISNLNFTGNDLSGFLNQYALDNQTDDTVHHNGNYFGTISKAGYDGINGIIQRTRGAVSYSNWANADFTELYTTANTLYTSLANSGFAEGDSGTTGGIYGYNAFSNIYDATINAHTQLGVIYVDGGTYTENVHVHASVTLTGEFTIDGTLLFSNTGTLSPGNSPGIINTGDLEMASGSTLEIEIQGTAVGTEYDQVNISGTVDIDGVILDTSLGYYPATTGDSFTIINNDDVDAIIGTFDGLAEGASFVISYGGVDFDATISYVGGDGNDVVITTDAYAVTDVYVDDDWSDITISDDPDATGPATAFGYDAFDNITDAMAAVSDGGTIHILDGIYTENDITINKAVSVVGTGSDLVTLDAFVTVSGNTNGFLIQADDVSLTGMTILNAVDSIQIDGQTISNLNINDLVFEENTSLGYGSSGVTISNSTVANMTLANSHFINIYNGINLYNASRIDGLTVTDSTFHVDNDGIKGPISDLTLTGSTFSNNSVGLRAELFGNIFIDDNTFTSNITGLFISNDADAANGPTDQILIQNNTFTDHKLSAIRFVESADLGVRVLDVPLTIQNNTFTQIANSVGYDIFPIDIRLMDGVTHQAVNIFENDITLTGTVTSAHQVGAISVRGNLSDVNIQRNTIDGGNIGSFTGEIITSGIVLAINSFDESSGNNLGYIGNGDSLYIANNFINNFDSAFTVINAINTGTNYAGVPTGAEVILFDNDLSANTAVITSLTGEVIDASGNWWGMTDIAAVVGMIAGDVDSSPILNSGTDTSTDAGFQGDFSALTVHQSGNQTSAIIGEGLAAIATGATLTVSPGTYTEDVIVGNGVTLKGSFNLDGTLTLTDGATLAPGTSPGIMNTGNIVMGSGTTLDIEIDGTTVGTEHDQLNVTGTVNITDSTLNVILGYTPTVGDSYIIINNDLTDTITGTFDGLAEGAVFAVGSSLLRITYVGGTDNNDVVLTVVSIADIYVDDDWVGLSFGDDPDGAGPATAFGFDAFATIQEGVDAVATDGTVHVYAGTYAGDINIDQNLTLQGESGDSADVVIDAATATNGFDITSGVTDLTLSHFSVFDASGIGINAAGTAATYTFEDLVVRRSGGTGVMLDNPGGEIQLTDVESSDNFNTGLFVNAANNFTDTRGNFHFNDNGGIILQDILNDVTMTRTLINNNDNNNDGLGNGLTAQKSVESVAVGGNMLLYGVRMSDTDGANTVKYQEYGLYVEDGVGGNVLLQEHDDGTDIIYSGAVGNDVSGVHLRYVEGNIDIHAGFYTLNADSGIFIQNGNGFVTIDGINANGNEQGAYIRNTDGLITNSTFNNNNYGIRLRANTEVSIVDNDITSNVTGIRALNSRALIESNDLSDNASVGLEIDGDATVDAGDSLDNNVTGLGTGSMPNGSSAGLNDFLGYDGTTSFAINNLNEDADDNIDVLAEMNAFGFVGYDFIENVINHDVDDSDLTEVFFGYAIPAATVNDVYVDDDWDSVALFADPDGAGPATAMGIDAFYDIQDGVDAVADAGTVHVYDGIYLENVRIEHDLTVTGVSQDPDMVIVNGQDLGQVFEIEDVDDVTIEYLTARNGDDDVIDIEDAGKVLINQVKVFFADEDGIDAHFTDELIVRDSLIQYMGDDGISLFNVGYVTIENTVIEDGNGTGIVFKSGALLDIDGLTIKNFADHGIQTEGVQTADVFDANISKMGNSGLELWYGESVILQQVIIDDVYDWGVDIYDQLSATLIDVTVTKAGNDGIWIDFVDEVTLTRVTSQFNDVDGIYLTGIGDIALLDVNSSYNKAIGLNIELAESLADTNGIYTENEDSGISVVYVMGESTFTRTTATNNNADFGDYGVGLEIYGFPFFDDLDFYYGGFFDFVGGLSLPFDFFDLLPDEFLDFDFGLLPFVAGGSVTIEGGTFSDTDGNVYNGNIYSQTAGIVIEGIAGDINIIAHDNGSDIQTTDVSGNDEIGVVLYDIAANTTIEDATITGNYGEGLDVDNAYDLTIANTTVEGNNGFGLWVTNVEDVIFTDNIVQSNFLAVLLTGAESVIVNDGLYAENDYTGIALNAVKTNLTMTGTIIRDNGTYGLWLTDDENVNISQVTSSGNDIGVYVKDYLPQFELTNSFITGNRVGVQVGELLINYSLTVFDNDLSGNTELAIQNFDTSSVGTIETVDASGNWFGTTDESTIDVMVDGAVDFTPYLATGTDTSIAAGFQGDFSTLYVTALGEQTTTDGRITQAVNLNSSTTGTIIINDGTYTEDVTIGDSMTLTGTGIIDGTLSLLDNAKLVPGSSPGTLEVDQLIASDSNQTLFVEINGTTPGTEHDQLVVNGPVTLNGMTLDVTLGYVPSGGETITLINNLDADPVNGTFDGLAQDATVTISGYDATISYTGGDGNDVELVFVNPNTAPTAGDVNGVAVEDGGPVVIAYNADDVDPDDSTSTLSYNFITLPGEGSVSDNGDGTFTFDPGTDFQDLGVGETRQVSFTYQATDSHSDSSTIAIITITVQGTNDGINAAPNLVSTQYQTAIDIDVLSNDVDIDGDTLHVSGIETATWVPSPSGTSALGVTVTINGDNTLHYDPTGLFDTLAPGETVRDSFQYFAADPYGKWDRHWVFVDVTRPVVSTTTTTSSSTSSSTLSSSSAPNYASNTSGATFGTTVNQAALAFVSQQAKLHVMPKLSAGSHWLNSLLGDDNDDKTQVNLLNVETE